ncbi:ABC transporter permease [Mucilaginibacter sp. L3T2-6]|uniref:ABC transporter permease n=1 Tax=Mucilaginibacter sp. L3T2-6 TaxID=3062491 RepID=UPI0026758C8A|nr:ABC transporter permease [Mucilaginibacter sp. L3T2-6]MDO3644974.1 ABC transporter permease [Mucilaginibacter sp. L3T2-6]MDV6217400.1 FtsX-like permease family protein [Mucilaginibacter sp. L3T2-6]
MIKNYLKIAWRNIWKNKVFSAINIVGLSIGMAACIVIMLFVTYEKSFDNFHTKNIYKLDEVQKFPGMVASQKVGLSMFPMGPTLQADFPEVKDFTRIHWEDKFKVVNGEKKVFLPEVFFVDTTFLNIFDFKLLKGDRNGALLKPHSIVLTEETAAKIFGSEDAMGKTVTHFGGDTTAYTVTGIAANPPINSQLQFDALLSFNTIINKRMSENWGGNWLSTFLVMAPGTDMKAFEKKMPAYLKKHMGDERSKYYELFYLPLKDVHANSADIGLDHLNFQKFDKNITNLFLGIALIVLVIACINFINLSTARSAERAKEVGIRKSIGAQRVQLAVQFLGETVLLSLIALVFAVILVEIALPFINSLSRRELSLPIFSNPGLTLLIVLCTALVGLISGIYPAVYLSGFQPVKVLKGSVQTGRNKGMLRNVLVVGQFTSAVFLMIATILVVKQLNFMQTKDPGFSREQVVTVPLNMVSPQKYDLMKQQLLSSSLISGVTAAQDNLGSHLDQSGIEFKLEDAPKRQLTSTRLIVDNDYLKLYKIKLLLGKNFSGEKQQDGREYIINEALAKELLKDHPGRPMSSLLGARFGYDSLGTIKGVARDFNFNSLHYKVETLFMLSYKGEGFSTMSVKINPGRISEAINFIKSTWRNVEPDLPFEYQFLDDHFNEVYQVDDQVSKIVGILAGLIIIISCLGLFGLASYSAEKRIKEIGIRKVLGATVQNITLLLSKNFLRLVLLANLIAWPIAWIMMHRWLQDFAYRISIQWWIFALAGIISILIAFFTVSFQSIKAAVANPVKSLRSE